MRKKGSRITGPPRRTTKNTKYHLYEDQVEYLRVLSPKLHIGMSEMVREAVDEYIVKYAHLVHKKNFMD